MLQLSKHIIKNIEAFRVSEAKRGGTDSLDELVNCYELLNIHKKNLDILNSQRNGLGPLFKKVSKGDEVEYKIPQVILDQYKELLEIEELDIEPTVKVFSDCKEIKVYKYTKTKELKDMGSIIKYMADNTKVSIDYLNNKMNDISENIGNILDDSVEEKDTVVATMEDTTLEKDEEIKEIIHVDIMEKMGLLTGPDIAKHSGNRSYVLSGDLFRLKHALVSYCMDFIKDLDCKIMQVPVFINEKSIKKVCQLSDFEETLYEVKSNSRSGKETEGMYLTATSEQFMVAHHENKCFKKSELPQRYCAFNECFRKEVGAHGRDTKGIFRIHQFEKFEQFVVCDPEHSDVEFKNLMDNIVKFYSSLGLGFQIIKMGAKDLNKSTSKKYDLEAWFPRSKTYRELVSCSNCTDYQAIKVNCKIGDGKDKKYVHMLNCTLCAIQRTLCCLVETHYDEKRDAILIPSILRKYMAYEEVIDLSTK